MVEKKKKKKFANKLLVVLYFVQVAIADVI